MNLDKELHALQHFVSSVIRANLVTIPEVKEIMAHEFGAFRSCDLHQTERAAFLMAIAEKHHEKNKGTYEKATYEALGGRGT